MSSPREPIGLSLSPNTNPALRLICVPYAGGGTPVYHKWPEGLSPRIQVCTVQLPGRDSRIAIPPFRHVTPLVDALLPVIEPYLDRPFALFGHSMGGLVVFELARALVETRQLRPVHFLVSACRAPQRPRQVKNLHHLPDEDFIRELSERYQGIPDVVMSDRELLQMFVRVLRADLELVETYVDESNVRFDFPVSAFAGLKDTQVNRDDMEAWRLRTSDRFQLHTLPGGHFFINTARPSLLRVINHELKVYCS